MFFTSGTTGPNKVMPYNNEKMARVARTMELMVRLADVEGTKENPCNSFNFFTAKLPNLGFWQCTMLSNFNWIRNFDIGDAPIELAWKIFGSYRPNLLAGKSADLSNLILKTPPELLKDVKQVITGGGPALMDLVELVEKMPNAELLSVYGQTETGICFITEYGKRKEGYVIPDDVKVEIKDGQLIVNDFETGDLGSINRFGKIDLGITRISKRETIC